MRLRISWVVAVGLAAASTWLVFECKRLAELVGQQEIDARAARTAASTAQLALATLTEAHAAANANVGRLEAELRTTGGQLAVMADAVKQRAELDLARAASSAAADARAMAPMPEGVRNCLASLHECLRAEGFNNHRFLSAQRLDGEGLHQVELLVTHADGLGVDVMQAGRMVAELDRGKGRLVLRLFDGFRVEAGERVALPADGWSIVFTPIDAQLFEERLPFLVRVEGVYPESEVRMRAVSDLDSTTRLQWLDRFDRLLANAGTPEELRVNRCRGLHSGHFLTVQLLGADSKHRLLLSADCARMAVEIDPVGGVVSLLLQDGVLRRGGVESTISAEGYRMLLPKVTPKQATDCMLGMVVTK